MAGVSVHTFLGVNHASSVRTAACEILATERVPSISFIYLLFLMLWRPSTHQNAPSPLFIRIIISSTLKIMAVSLKLLQMWFREQEYTEKRRWKQGG
jgi:hypothetical protein